MDFTGELVQITKDFATGKWQAIFTVNEPNAVNGLDKLKNTLLTVKAAKFRKKRSLDANAMMWACLKEIADVINADKWDIYLRMLKRYGKFTYVVVKENAVEAMKKQWRECEVVGDYEVNGQKAVQMLCYFGSSTYDTKEFSKLLNGIVSEMQEMGIQPPPSKEMQRTLENWEKERKIEKC